MAGSNLWASTANSSRSSIPNPPAALPTPPPSPLLLPCSRHEPTTTTTSISPRPAACWAAPWGCIWPRTRPPPLPSLAARRRLRRGRLLGRPTHPHCTSGGHHHHHLRPLLLRHHHLPRPPHRMRRRRRHRPRHLLPPRHLPRGWLLQRLLLRPVRADRRLSFPSETSPLGPPSLNLPAQVQGAVR